MFERTCEQCLPNLCFHRNHIIRCSLIEQIEKEKDWQFTGEQAAELIRMAIYPDLRSEEERMQYEDFLMNGLARFMSENEK